MGTQVQIADLTNDVMLESAMMLQFERIGETLRLVRDRSPEFAETIPEIHQWIALRHRLIHDYRSVDLDLLWYSATNEVPTLIRDLEARLRAK